METKVAIISIIIQDMEKASDVNNLLHEYSEYIIGRLGLPYKEKKISVISIVLDAPTDKTSALSGKLGMIKGISTKTVTSKI